MLPHYFESQFNPYISYDLIEEITVLVDDLQIGWKCQNRIAKKLYL